MRVMLACSLGGEGHLLPLAQVGHAIERAGHEVLLLVPPAMARSADRAGLRFRIGEEPPREVVDDVWRRVRAGPPDAVAGLIDRELFAERCTDRMLAPARAVSGEWRPDLVVREPCEYASAIVAHESGTRQAQAAISSARIEFAVLSTVAPIIDGFSRGVAAAIASAPYLSSFPLSLDPSPWPDTRRFRPSPATTAASNAERPSDRRPLLYVSFGTVLGQLPEALDVYRGALDAVSELPVRVLMSVGRTVDRTALGPIPRNTRVEPWVRQDVVLKEAAAVVCHGGSGTTLGALAAGVPLIILPLFADQPLNGQAVAAAGAGVVVEGRRPAVGGVRRFGPEDVAALRACVEQVLSAPSYRGAAAAVAAEIAATATLDEVVTRLLLTSV